MNANGDIGGFATFDNINHKLIDDLKAQLREDCRLQIAAASFSIYAYEALKEELEQIKELQFIFTSPTFNSSETDKMWMVCCCMRKRRRISCQTTKCN